MAITDRKSKPVTPSTHLYWLHYRTLEPFIQTQMGFAEAPLLDLGCGNKPYAPLYPEGKCVGIDVNQSSMNCVDRFIVPGKPLPCEDGEFKTVLCTQVLEHVEDPIWLLDEITRVLQPGGRVILTVPFVWELHERPHDFARYSEYYLAKKFEERNYKIQEFQRQGGDVATIGQLILLLMAVRQWHLPKFLQRIYNKAFSFIDRKSNTQCMPLNYGIVAIKKPIVAGA